MNYFMNVLWIFKTLSNFRRHLHGLFHLNAFIQVHISCEKWLA